jgi:hypothetical protein
MRLRIMQSKVVVKQKMKGFREDRDSAGSEEIFDCEIFTGSKERSKF